MFNNINSQNNFTTCPGFFPLNKNIDVSEFQKDELKDKYNLELVAHRGYSAKAPENTLSAFNMASDNGYSTVECDVSWTKDEIPVILHDETINRTARNKFGFRPLFPRKCEKMNYEDLLKYDFGSSFSKEFKGEKIPTLKETLDDSVENGYNLYIELKEASNFDSEKAEILTDLVDKANAGDNVTWISFEEDYLKEISELLPTARLGYLSKTTPDEKTIETLKDLDNGQNEVFLDVKASKMNEENSEMLSDAGYSFEAWTVDDYKTLEKMYSYGCKGVTTNALLDDEVLNYLNEAEN